MKHLRTLSLTVLLALLTANVAAPAFASVDSCLTIQNNIVTDGQSCGVVVIPASVTSIRDYAFVSSSVTNVSFEAGSNLATIGNSAFESATSLTSITIPNSVTSIGNSAFESATSLTSITIPSSVISIGDYAFYNTTSLTSITIPNSVTSIGDYAFYITTSLTSITIPNSVTSIGEAAFALATALTTLNFEAGITPTSIGDYAFAFARSLTTVNFEAGSTLTSIGALAFYAAGSLTSITIPSSVTSIGDYAFASARSLAAVNFSGNAPSVGPGAFSSIGIEPKANIGFLATGFGGGPTWEGLTIVRAAAVAPIADSEPTPPAPYTGPLPSNYSNSTPSIGEEVTITGRRLNLVDTCTIDGIDVQISNQSADSFTILIPVGLEPGLKDLVMTGPSGALTALRAITIQQPKVEITNEALVSTKLNAGSFNGYVAVYAKGHKGKILSWKIGNKWFKTTITSNYQVFQRKILNVGQDMLVDIYVDSQQSMTRVVVSR